MYRNRTFVFPNLPSATVATPVTFADFIARIASSARVAGNDAVLRSDVCNQCGQTFADDQKGARNLIKKVPR